LCPPCLHTAELHALRPVYAGRYPVFAPPVISFRPLQQEKSTLQKADFSCRHKTNERHVFKERGMSENMLNNFAIFVGVMKRRM
jgi:hypothetical protein